MKTSSSSTIITTTSTISSTSNSMQYGDDNNDDDAYDAYDDVSIEITSSSNDSGNIINKYSKRHKQKQQQQNAAAATTTIKRRHHHHHFPRRRHHRRFVWMIFCFVGAALIVACRSLVTVSSPFYDYYYYSIMISNNNEESSIRPYYYDESSSSSQGQQQINQIPKEKEGSTSRRYRIFHCGYKFGKFKQVLFPNPKNDDNKFFDYVGTYYGPKHNITQYETDILFYGIHGHCPTSYGTIINNFHGKILLINGEPFGVKPSLLPKKYIIQQKNKKNKNKKKQQQQLKKTITNLNHNQNHNNNNQTNIIIQIGMRPTKGNPNGILFPGLNRHGKQQTYKKSKIIDTYYGPMALFGYIPPEQYKPLLLSSITSTTTTNNNNHPKLTRPKNYYVLNYNNNNNNGDNSSSNSNNSNMIPGNRVIYMASRCYDHRQNAAKLINDIVTVDAMGYCKITNTTSTTTTTTTITPPLPASAISTLTSTLTNSTTTERQRNAIIDSSISRLSPRKNHFSNWQIYKRYKYCLVMENSNPVTYISEKLFYAFVGGCLPIYWGNRNDIYKLINPKSFIWWNIRHPKQTLQQIRYLQSNYTAYLEMLNQPILASSTTSTSSSGNHTTTTQSSSAEEEILRKYFSYSDDIGNGYIKKLIHKSLGIV